MKLIATYSFRYGQGPYDAEPTVLQRGEEFEPRPSGQASREESARFLVRAGVALAPEDYAKRRLLIETNGKWADDHVATLNARRAAK